ncbi:MAG: thioredoxin family protein [Clostridia bacterium]
MPRSDVGAVADAPAEETAMDKKHNLLLKIMVPVLIVIAVGAIWLFKNPASVKPTPETISTPIPATTKSATAQSTSSVTDAPSATEQPSPAAADFTLEVTEMVDFAALAEHQLPAIVDYGSDSCIPCKEMAPVLEKLNKEFSGKAFIKFMDVWKHGDAARNVPMQVIPTQVLFNADGTPFTPSESLAGQLQFTLYSSKETNEPIFTVHQGGLTEDQMRAILKEMGVE